MRLFVAVNLSSDERDRLRAATAGLRASPLPVRWLGPEAYHLTLKFLGEVPESAVAAVGQALAAAAADARTFTLELCGAGVFPNPRRPAVWWIGVLPSEPLAALRDGVERGLAAIGHPTEARPFAPHLTIGRTRPKAQPGALRGAEAWLQDVDYHSTITVETVDLMRSHLASGGARYERLRAAALRS
jgi:2'-5' RNA ligase